MKGCKTVEEKRRALFKQIAEVKYLPYEWEHAESLYYRIHIEGKKKLREIVLKHGLKDGELLVVGHALTYCFMWGDGWNVVDKKPKKFRIMKNAEFAEFPQYWQLKNGHEIDFANWSRTDEEKKITHLQPDQGDVGIEIYSNRQEEDGDDETGGESKEKLDSYFETSDKKGVDPDKMDSIGEKEIVMQEKKPNDPQRKYSDDPKINKA